MVKRGSASLRKSAKALLKRAKVAERKEKKEKKEKKAKKERAKKEKKEKAKTRRRAGVRKSVKDHGSMSTVESRRRRRARNSRNKRSDYHRKIRTDDVLDIVIMGHGLSPNNDSSTELGHLSVAEWAGIRGMNSAHLTDTTDKSWETDWYNCAIPGHNAYGSGSHNLMDGEILTETVSDLREKGITKKGTTIEIASAINSGMTDTFHSMNTKPYGASKRNVLCFFYEPDSSQSDPDPTTGHPGSSDIQIHNWPGIYNVQFKPKLIQKQSQVIEASMLGDKDKFRGTLARDMALDPKCNVTADVLNKLAEDDPAYMAWSDNTPTPGARGYVFPTGNQMVVPLIRIEEALVALHPHVKRINFYSHLCLGRWDGEKVVGNTDSLDNDINYNISEALGAVSTDERRVFPTFTTSADKTQQDKIHIRQEELSRFQADKDKQGSMIPDTIAEIDGSGEDDDDDDDDDDVDDVDDVGHGFR